MNFRLTAIIFGLVTLTVAVLLAVVLLDDTEPIPTGQGLVPGLAAAGVKPKDVDTVEIVRSPSGDGAEEKLVLVRDEKSGWKATEPFPARVDGAEVDAVVQALFTTTPFAHPELTGNLSVHGLDKPTVRVTLKAGTGTSAAVSLGLTTIGKEKAITFVATSANPRQPLAVRRADLAPLFRDAGRDKDGPALALAKWLPDFRAKQLLAQDVRDAVTQVQSVKLSAGGKELALSNQKGTWVYDSPANYGAADVNGAAEAADPNAPLTGVRPLLNLLTTLRIDDVTDFIEKPEDLSTYGLQPGEPSAIRVELKTAQSADPQVLHLGKPVEADKTPQAMGSGPKVYGRLEGDRTVLRIPMGRLDALRATIANPGELRDKDLLAAARRGQADAIDLTHGGQTLKLRLMRVGPDLEWLLYGGPAGPQPVRQAEVAALLNAFTASKAVKEVVGAPTDAAFVPPEVKSTVKIWFGGLEKPEAGDAASLPPEPKTVGAPVEFVFGKAEGDAVFVRKTADGKAIDLKVFARVLPVATKGRGDLIDPKIRPFDTGKATKLALHRGAEPVEVVRKDGGWRFEKPEPRKDQVADGPRTMALIGLIAGLFADQVVAEQPTPEQLKAWGLDPAAPRLRAAVTLDDPIDKERVFLFGNETEDKRSVYAMIPGKPLVFTVPAATFGRLAGDDPRDHTLFTLDPAKVKRITFRGWADTLGANAPNYVAKRDGANWVGESPAGFAPDPAKVNALLAALAAPRAESILPIGGVPNHGVTVGNPKRLEITIERDGGPPVVFVLGNEAPDGRVYGTTSLLSNEVFTFIPTAIRPLIDKPKSLEK